MVRLLDARRRRQHVLGLDATASALQLTTAASGRRARWRTGAARCRPPRRRSCATCSCGASPAADAAVAGPEESLRFWGRAFRARSGFVNLSDKSGEVVRQVGNSPRAALRGFAAERDIDPRRLPERLSRDSRFRAPPLRPLLAVAVFAVAGAVLSGCASAQRRPHRHPPFLSPTDASILTDVCPATVVVQARGNRGRPRPVLRTRGTRRPSSTPTRRASRARSSTRARAPACRSRSARAAPPSATSPWPRRCTRTPRSPSAACRPRTASRVPPRSRPSASSRRVSRAPR